MIRKILVPTDGSETANVGVHYAVALAQRSGAALYGLHVIDVKLLEGPFLRDLSASLGTAPYVNYQGNITLILEERGKAALEVFREACEKVGVPCDTEQCTGVVAHEIAAHSELADLVVMGRAGEHGPWIEGLLGSTTQAVVRRAHAPVLVTGAAAIEGNLLLTVYDGSDHAKSALRLAAEWASQWQAPLHVLSVGEDIAEKRLAEAGEYLEAYAIEVTPVQKQGDPSETIVEYARTRGADLLIMGAYGHSKVREWVLGSKTSYALNHSPCPVLLVR
ncbi:MAG: universal stress protein [Candidatus Hydrogenedentota bacterium]